MQRPGIGVGIIVYDITQKRIMIGRRKDNSLYSLSGGHVEKFETFEKTASRELMEETAIKVHPNQIYLYDHINAIRKEKDYHFLCVFLCVKYPLDQKPINTEPNKHDDWEWLDAEQIQELYNKIKSQKLLFYGLQDLITKKGGVQFLFNDIQKILAEKEIIQI